LPDKIVEEQTGTEMVLKNKKRQQKLKTVLWESNRMMLPEVSADETEAQGNASGVSSDETEAQGNYPGVSSDATEAQGNIPEVSADETEAQEIEVDSLLIIRLKRLKILKHKFLKTEKSKCKMVYPPGIFRL
jgi:hypothetical protein